MHLPSAGQFFGKCNLLLMFDDFQDLGDFHVGDFGAAASGGSDFEKKHLLFIFADFRDFGDFHAGDFGGSCLRWVRF